MCGRFSLSSSPEAVSGFFKGLKIPIPLEPRYNIAPSQDVLAIRTDNQGVMLRWGLIPTWARDKSIGYKMINTRAETVSEKPSFTAAYHSRRCLIPTDGFYEWKRDESGKQPYHIRRADRGVFFFAGLWEAWTNRETGEIIKSCTIITTGANPLLKPIHDRMPVVLKPEVLDRWLVGDNVGELLKPYEWQEFRAVPVSDYVNSVKNDGPECIVEINPIDFFT